MTNEYTQAELKADRKTAMATAAVAARHAAAMDWRPCWEGELVAGDFYGAWSCCALGAVALQHKLDSQVGEHTMEDILFDVEDMSLSQTLDGVAGIKDRPHASRSVARVFDRMATTYHRARYGLPLNDIDRAVLEENNIADREDFGHLSASDFWLLVARRFEGLSR